MEKKEALSPPTPTTPTTPITPVSPSTGDLPKRLILCIDGTPYDSRSDRPQTNVYRIYASVQSGRCSEAGSGIEFNQIPRYFPGSSAADDVLSKNVLRTALPGHGYHSQVENIYEACCELTGERDEVVFFGFAQGAYVARAVAGLLHDFGALDSVQTSNFHRDFKKLRSRLDDSSPRSPLSPALERASTISSLSNLSADDFRIPPRIRFLGLFDTVKGIYGDSGLDISFKASILHLRHALALHEDRRVLTPEAIHPQDSGGLRLRDTGRSLVQAWFVGNHQDMGGSSAKAGLGLYPLQWMILEANACGVWFDFEGHQHRGSLEKPLSAVFPTQRNGKQAAKASFTASNGVVATMHDLRTVHDLPQHKGSYAVRLTTRQVSIRMKKARSPFDKDGYLRGFCDYAPQGTVIHPSVYLLLDEHVNVALDTKEAKLQRHLEDWRERMLGIKNGVVNFGFWGDDNSDDTSEPGAIRVLVCGNTGVGKSTLINKTFGVDVTQSSERSRGIHDVKQEITFEGRPDLIVHDSGGFEAGADTEFRAIEEFLKAKSSIIDVRERLHVIWFCIEINSSRTLQTATEKLFQAVSKYAKEVPIVVVATKKDDLIDLEFSKRRKELKRLKQPFDEDACDRYAEEQLQSRLEQIRDEMESVPDGRLDAIVAVSQDDEESIAQLSKITSRCFDTDKVRLLYIRAQVTRVDLKVDLALCEVMRRYRILVRRATGVSYTVIGPTAHRKSASDKVCKAILHCFGLPTVSADGVLDAVRQNVWKHLGIDFSTALAECMNAMGYIGTGFGGGIPAWIVTGSLSVPLVVPSTCRLFLTMACDLIFTLVRSFKETTFRERENGHPNGRDVQAAARMYRISGYSEQVHHDIRKLIPKRNVAACYMFDKIQTTLDGLMKDYKDKMLEGIDLSVNKLRVHDDEEDDLRSPSSTGRFLSELREAQRAAVELQANEKIGELSVRRDGGAVELEGDLKKRNELPVKEIAAAELEAPRDKKRIAELPG